jgi:hypothetical protein
VRFDDDCFNPKTILLTWKLSSNEVVFEKMSYTFFKAIDNKKIWIKYMTAPDPPVCGLLTGLPQLQLTQELPTNVQDTNGR